MAGDQIPSQRRTGRSVVLSRVRGGVLLIVAVLVVEYFVVPQLVGASKNFAILRHVSFGWLAAATALEGSALLSYAMLTRTLLPGARPPLSQLIRIVLATTGISHVLPGGTVGGSGLGYRLLTTRGSWEPTRRSCWQVRRSSRRWS